MSSILVPLNQSATRFRARRFVFLFFLGLVFIPLPITTVESTTHHLRLEASSFAFTPHTIRVNPGDKVVIDLQANDVVHGLYLDGYDLAVTADPGQTSQLSFIADRPGTFRFRCSVTCGPLHPFMIGKLQVGGNQLLWRGVVLAFLLGVGGLVRWRR